MLAVSGSIDPERAPLQTLVAPSLEERDVSDPVRSDLVIDDRAEIDGGLRLTVFPEGDTCVVRATGELDRATRDQLIAASTAGSHHQMSIDLSAVTFMDCGGYGGLVASRRRIEEDGRTLTISGGTGQPKHLLDLIERLEGGDTGRVDTSTISGYHLSLLGTRASRRQPRPPLGARGMGT